eukprot:729633-Ditylum_brightwellii.AAC.1
MFAPNVSSGTILCYSTARSIGAAQQITDTLISVNPMKYFTGKNSTKILLSWSIVPPDTKYSIEE